MTNWLISVLTILSACVPATGNAQQPPATLNVRTDGGAVGDGVTDDAAAIQSVLEMARTQGADLFFPPGTYVIGSPVTTREGVSLYGDHAGLSIIRSAPGTVQTVGNQTWNDPSSNIDVEDLHFLNTDLHWYGSESVRRNINVRRCLFFANDPAFLTTTSHSQFQIALGHVVDGTVEDCVFLLQSNCTAESVSGYKNVRQIYRRSVWGVHLDRTGWLETEWQGHSAWINLRPKLQTVRVQFGLAADQGYFRRALKINGSEGTRVEHNIFNGSPYTLSVPVNRDHVVYAHGGYADLEVLANWMRGWPSAPNGGLKIRNTHGTSTVIANYFVNTPLLQYAYDNNTPQAYQNAIVHRNHFEIYQNFSDSRLGISFWETVDGIPPQTNNAYSSNLFECPKSYSNAINLTNGDTDGHTAYDSNVYLSDGTPVSSIRQGGPFPLVPGAPDSSRTAPYDAYQIPALAIPTFTTDPEFTTNVIDLGLVAVGQPLSGTLTNLASDADGESLEFMKMDGPEWLQVELAGTYSGTPSINDTGVNEFTVRAADNRDGYAAATLRVSVGTHLMVIQPIHDTHVAQESPDSSYGANTKLVLRSDKYSAAMNGFLMFDVDTSGLDIAHARLKLYCSHKEITMRVHEVADATWTESTMTWNNQPVLGSNLVTQAVGTNVWEEFDVTGSVVTNGLVCFGLTSTLASYSNVDTKEGSHPPILEIELAVDPNDWDGDGLPNDWELEFFGGETNAIASGHSDDDGFDNLSEFIAGTDPTNSSSCFRASVTSDGSGFVISWNAVSNRTYGVWHSSSPGIGFTNFQSGILYPQNSYTDALHPAEASGFYKVDVQLAP